MDNFFHRKNLILPEKFSETDIIEMLEFLIDNIFAVFGKRVFQHAIGIPMAPNCAHFIIDLLFNKIRICTYGIMSANQFSRHSE
jgi:hypothetical protein